MINKIFLPFILAMFVTLVTCEADMMVFNEKTDTRIPPGLLMKQNVPSMPNKAPAQKIKRHSTPLTTEEMQSNSKYAGFLSEVSADYKINRNRLSLTQIPMSRRKQSFMFVVLMNQNKIESKKVNEHSQMHVLWTGSKKVVSEQKLIRDEYPVDVSIGHYSDGYAPGELNLVLPNKKPREVAVSLVWSF